MRWTRVSDPPLATVKVEPELHTEIPLLPTLSSILLSPIGIISTRKTSRQQMDCRRFVEARPVLTAYRRCLSKKRCLHLDDENSTFIVTFTIISPHNFKLQHRELCHPKCQLNSFRMTVFSRLDRFCVRRNRGKEVWEGEKNRKVKVEKSDNPHDT